MVLVQNEGECARGIVTISEKICDRRTDTWIGTLLNIASPEVSAIFNKRVSLNTTLKGSKPFTFIDAVITAPFAIALVLILFALFFLFSYSLVLAIYFSAVFQLIFTFYQPIFRRF